MSTQKEVLERLINRSILLSEENRTMLLASLPSMDDRACEKLKKILAREDDILEQSALQAIANAVECGDTDFLTSLDDVLHAAMRSLRHAHERADRSREQDTADTSLRLFP